MRIALYEEARVVTVKRRAACRSCDFGEGRFTRGMRRVVLSGGMGIASRHLSLCAECAEWEAQRLEHLAQQMRFAARGCVA